MPEEIGLILDNLKNIKSKKFGDLEIFSGIYISDNYKEVFVTTAWSGWGKVSSARATTRLLSSNLHSKPVEIILFTGVAGAIDTKLNQWDIVLADSVIQHDMDARPLFDKYVIPAIKNKKIIPDNEFIDSIYLSFKNYLIQENDSKFGSIYKGLIGTGDMFISDIKKLNQLSREIPGLSAVEMEGAAFAQVAHQENVNWLVIRVISDSANENASNDFNKFLREYKLKSFDLIKHFLDTLIKGCSANF